ncbi:MAG: hypothetical protein ACK4WF_01205 [Candidatus Brocadiales bacterium]
MARSLLVIFIMILGVAIPLGAKEVAGPPPAKERVVGVTLLTRDVFPQHLQ